MLNGLLQSVLSYEFNDFIEGEHFKKMLIGERQDLLLNQAESQKDKRIPQILVFFNYGCYGCWIFNNNLNIWLASQKSPMEVHYYPVAFNDMWEILAKLYYVNQQLQTYTNEELFNQIHEQHNKLWIESEMVALYGKKHVNKLKFINLYNSFDISRKTRNAIEISKKYKITITPNIVLNFKNNSYMINLTMNKDINSIFKIIEYLIQFTP